MPVTFLAHQAPVLPLKRRWSGLDGVALAVGSVVPDLARGTPPPLRVLPQWWDGHSIDRQLTFCLPVGLALTWLLRRVLAPALAPYLPDLGSFHLQDLRHVVRSRHRWWVIGASVLIGSATHVLVDGLTHPDGWAVLLVPGLEPLTPTLQVAASVGLSAVTVVEARRMGRSRDICRWSGVRPTPPVRPRAVVPVRVAALAVLALAAAGPLLAGAGSWVLAAMAATVWSVVGLSVLALVVRSAGLVTEPEPVGPGVP